MSTWMIALAAGAVLTAALVTYGVRRWRRFRRTLRQQIAHESVMGHTGVRRRVERLVGRRQDQFTQVLAADTMRGWVWFYWTRRPREGYRERTGWAPTKRLAQRRLRQVVERDTNPAP